jgi:hypothetical protein
MVSGGVISGGTASVEVQIDNVDSVSGSLYIRYVLFEDGVSEGGDTYNHVVRDMIEESVSSSDFPVAKQKDFTIGGSWNEANLGAAVFVQVGSNGEILQGVYEDFNGPLNQPPEVSNAGKVEHVIKEDISDSTLDLKTIFTDPESDALTFTSSADETSNVQVTIVDGVATLLSKTNWNGEEDVTFYATDSAYHDPVPHTIKIIVQAVNDAPVAIPDNLDFIMTEDSTNSDIDLDNVFSDVDTGDTMTFSVTGNNNLGVTISADNTAFIDSSGEFHDAETITFIATDQSGATGTKDVKVTVRSQNDKPVVLDALIDFSINEDTEDYSIDLSRIFMDPDGDQLYFTYDQNKHIGVSIDGSGKVTITPRQDWFGEETIVFKATDKLSPNVPEDVTITVLPINDPPVAEEVFELYVYEDEDYDYQFEAKDIEDDSITFELNIRSVIKGLEKGKNYFFDDATGELTITPTNEMVGEYTVELIVKDDGNPPAESEPLQFSITIENTNDAPTNVKILQPLPGTVVDKETTINFIGSAEDVDLLVKDSGETLIYRWESDKMIGLIGEGEAISKVLEPGEHKITLKVYDSANAVSMASITITVEDPAAKGDPTTSDPTQVESGGNIDTLWILLVAIVAVIIVVFVVTLMFMRKKKPELTPEEQQLQQYYDTLQNQGMLDPMAQQSQYGNMGYQQGYGAYPQQQTAYPQQQMVYPQQVAQPQPAAAVVAPVVAPSPKPAAVLPQAEVATPQLPPASIDTTNEELPRTKPVTPQTEQQNGAQQPKDWQWNV